MKNTFFLILFLTLAITALSSPTPVKGGGKSVSKSGNLGSKNGNVVSKGVKSSSGSNLASKGVKSSSKKSIKTNKRTMCKKAKANLDAKMKASKAKRELNFNTTKSGLGDPGLFRRAGETSLCGMSIRGSSARMCRENPAYLYTRETPTSTWHQWHDVADIMTSANIPSRYQCDHALELQLTVQALTQAGFCNAWTNLAHAWEQLDPRANVEQVMRGEFFGGGSLKESANAPRMLFFVDSVFNEQKRAFTSAFIRGAPRLATDLMKGYFDARVKSTVDSVAAEIDRAAADILKRIHARAYPEHYDENTADQRVQDLICALDSAALVTFESWRNPVQTAWGRMRALLG